LRNPFRLILVTAEKEYLDFFADEDFNEVADLDGDEGDLFCGNWRFGMTQVLRKERLPCGRGHRLDESRD
jgi:hypothetical protein